MPPVPAERRTSLVGAATPAVAVKKQRLDGTPGVVTPMAGPVLTPGVRVGVPLVAGPVMAAPSTVMMPAPQLPTTTDHNLLGRKLSDAWQPFLPSGEALVTVPLNIDGSQMTPPQERSYHDEVLWNAREPPEHIDAFARMTCEEEGLPPPFVEEIARAIRRVAEAGVRVPPQGLAPLQLEVARNGVLLQDRVLWDTRPGSAAIKPEEFAATLCSDLALGSDFESGVALAVRHQLQRLQQRHTLGDAEAAAAAASASGAASGEPPSVVRGARETPPFY